MDKKGQVTIFIIIALVIVGGILIYYFVVPRVAPAIALGAAASPSQFLSGCMKPAAENAMNTLSKQGGYLNPEGYILYEGNKIKYLCYTSDYYKMCTVQQPFIKSHYEEELKTILQAKAKECAASLKSSYEKSGYSVTMPSVSLNLSIISGKIQMELIAPTTIRKGEETRTFDKFDFSAPSEIYDLLSIAGNIIEFEAYWGDSETVVYMQEYPNIEIWKVRLGDGSTIYIIGDVLTEEKFTFASRSLVWPAGYLTT